MSEGQLRGEGRGAVRARPAMSPGAAEAILSFVEGYAAVGLAIAVLFLLLGVDRVDPGAVGAWAFRPLLLPGVVMLWPLVLWRWVTGPPDGRVDATAAHRPPMSAQRSLALAMALAIPAIVALALVLRRDGPLERAPEPLDPPGTAAGRSP